jgi:hypothetical protein
MNDNEKQDQAESEQQKAKFSSTDKTQTYQWSIFHLGWFFKLFIHFFPALLDIDEFMRYLLNCEAQITDG